MKKKMLCVCVVLFAIFGVVSCFFVSAKEEPVVLVGKVYEFSEKSSYEYSAAANSAETNSSNTFGTFRILGDVDHTGRKDNFPAYSIHSKDIQFFYSYNRSKLATDETEWHIIEDKTKEVGGLTLGDNVLSGTVIVQSSKNRTDWIPDMIITDVFTEGSNFSDAFYTTKDIQLQNGCYYQVVVAYELLRQNKGKNEKKRIAEVYEFYAVSSEIDKYAASASDQLRKELGSKIKTEKDKGYTGDLEIGENDPHYGWDLGTFVINGYTSETSDNGVPVFLKSVGDKVTLWFTLDQDINQLNGEKALSISEDVNGYDQSFEVEKTNFKHGTILIRYTDHEGKKHEPVIYTDFLAAHAAAGADTRVQLFEEGDYEVCLDYEIKNDPRKIGGISIAPTYTNYKISFDFSIRNGNCMVYPFDIENGNELPDKAISTKGFKLDLAKSRYLKINVERSILNVGSNGLISEDIRFNDPAKDHASYVEDGIYTFTVKNSYTNETTTKRIFVGEDKYLLALAKNVLTVEALNEKIAQGWVVEEDGILTEPAPVSMPEPESSEQEKLASSKPQPSVSVSPPITEEEKIPVSAKAIEGKEENLIQYILPGAIVVVIVISVFGCIVRKRKGGKK